MKLIGATDFLVRAPFIVEGIVIGLIGAAIPLGVLYFMYQKIIVYIAAKFNFIGSMIVFEPVKVVSDTDSGGSYPWSRYRIYRQSDDDPQTFESIILLLLS